MTDPEALVATGLGHRFRGGWALRDCDFALPAGRVTALVGPEGAGKSTLFHLVTGLLRPTRGTLRVLGAEPGGPAVRERVAFLAQDKPLYPRFTVADTLRFGGEPNRDFDRAAAERIVRAGDIPLDAQVGTLSRGRCVRIALALALGKRPELLLLDEPLAGLDPSARHEIVDLVRTEAAGRGLTVVLSSHALPEPADACDHVLLLRDGGVRLAGDARRLVEEHRTVTGPADPETADGLPAGLDRSTVVRSAVVRTAVTGRQVTAVVRHAGPLGDPWTTETPTLEDLLLAAASSTHRPYNCPYDGKTPPGPSTPSAASTPFTTARVSTSAPAARIPFTAPSA